MATTRGQNGTAQAEVFSLGDLQEKTRPVKIVRDGKEVALKGYFEGDGCPVSILSQVSAARDRFFIRPDQRAWREAEDDLYTALVSIVVPDLAPEEVDLIAGYKDRRDGLLYYLDWISRPVAIADPKKDKADPEAEGGAASTTDASSPDSAASTSSPEVNS